MPPSTSYECPPDLRTTRIESYCAARASPSPIVDVLRGHADGGVQCLTAAKPDGPNSNKAKSGLENVTFIKGQIETRGLLRALHEPAHSNWMADQALGHAPLLAISR